MRNYKRKLGARKYRDYTPEDLAKAVQACRDGMSLRDAESAYGISRATLNRKLRQQHMGTPGHPTAFSAEEELMIKDCIVLVSSWGFPMTKNDLRHFVKDYLDRKNVTITAFPNNLPGSGWIDSFLKRNKDYLSTRLANNIKRARANVGPEDIKVYFDNLSETLKDIPPENIFNYDETNLSDDPGRKKVIAKRGVKYVDLVQNSTKASISIMFCGSASGHMLPPYTVYKAENMWNSWCTGGPRGSRFNRSKSGWFEGPHFQDWFEKMFLHHTRNLAGDKVLIGDNLSTHFNSEVLRSAKENHVKFVCLPPNSTHMCQPLDVAFFGPLKKYWRAILENFKRNNPKMANLAKDSFPNLLKELMEKIFVCGQENMKSGFRACGIYPFDPDQVLKRLPDYNPQEKDGEANSSIMSQSLISVLERLRREKKERRIVKKKKLNVEPGKSVVVDNSESDDDLPGPSNRSKKAPILESSSNESESESGEESQEDEDQAMVQDQNVYIEEIKDINSLKFGDWIAAKYEEKWFLAIIEQEAKDDLVCLKFIHPHGPKTKFQWPTKEDLLWVDLEALIGKLKEPPMPQGRYFVIAQEVCDYIQDLLSEIH